MPNDRADKPTTVYEHHDALRRVMAFAPRQRSVSAVIMFALDATHQPCGLPGQRHTVDAWPLRCPIPTNKGSPVRSLAKQKHFLARAN